MPKYSYTFSEEDEEDGNAPLLHASEMERRFPRAPKVSSTSAPLPSYQVELELDEGEPDDFPEEINEIDVEEDEPELDASYFSRGDTPSPAPSISAHSSIYVSPAFAKWPDGIERESGWVHPGRKSVRELFIIRNLTLFICTASWKNWHKYGTIAIV